MPCIKADLLISLHENRDAEAAWLDRPAGSLKAMAVRSTLADDPVGLAGCNWSARRTRHGYRRGDCEIDGRRFRKRKALVSEKKWTSEAGTILNEISPIRPPSGCPFLPAAGGAFRLSLRRSRSPAIVHSNGKCAQLHLRSTREASAKAGQGYPLGMPNIKLVDVVSQQGARRIKWHGHPRGAWIMWESWHPKLIAWSMNRIQVSSAPSTEET
jgi:hypothetical protein